MQVPPAVEFRRHQDRHLEDGKGRRRKDCVWKKLLGYGASSLTLYWDYAKRTTAVSSGGLTVTWQGKQSGIGERVRFEASTLEI